MKKTPSRAPRSAPRANYGNETPTDRFEFGRRHVIAQMKLEVKLDEARGELYRWKHTNHETGVPLPLNRWGKTQEYRPKSPEEREELRTLDNAVIDARVRLLLHENDGRTL